MPANRIYHLSKDTGVTRSPGKACGQAPSNQRTAATRPRFVDSISCTGAPPSGSSTAQKYAWLMSKVRERLDTLEPSANDVAKARGIWLAELTDDLAASFKNVQMTKALGSIFDDFLQTAQSTNAFTGSDADLGKFIHHLIGGIMTAEIDAQKNGTAASAKKPVDLFVPPVVRGQRFSWADTSDEEEEIDELCSDTSLLNSRAPSPALVGRQTPAPKAASGQVARSQPNCATPVKEPATLTSSGVSDATSAGAISVRKPSPDAPSTVAVRSTPLRPMAQFATPVLTALDLASATASKEPSAERLHLLPALTGPTFSMWSRDTSAVYQALLTHQRTPSVALALNYIRDLALLACLESPATAFTLETSDAQFYITAKSGQQSHKHFLLENVQRLIGPPMPPETRRDAQLILELPTGRRIIGIAQVEESYHRDQQEIVKEMIAGLGIIWQRAAMEPGHRTLLRWAEKIENLRLFSDVFLETMSFLYEESFRPDKINNGVAPCLGESHEEKAHRQITYFFYHFGQKFLEETNRPPRIDGHPIDPLFQERYFNEYRFCAYLKETGSLSDDCSHRDLRSLFQSLHDKCGLGLS